VTAVRAGRWAWAETDLDAVGANVATVRAAVSPAAVWAVVKANGYGHGAIDVARAALAAGADGLCVALTSEGVVLRDAGIDAPVLVLSQQPPDDATTIVDHRLTPTVYTREGVDALATAALASGRRLGVHVKVDTGMQRVGAAPADVLSLVEHVRGIGGALHVDGVFTHLACADEPDAPANAEQLDRFDAVLLELAERGVRPPVVHAANSAGALAHPAARRSFVRLGIAMYGISPGRGVDHLAAGLRPVMSLRARVSHVKRVVAGSHVSYGWRHRFDRDTVVATVPIGYADGVPRRLGTLPDRAGADVLIGDRRRPIVGVVTMDQLLVDVGPVADVAVGDEVVLLGRQGDQVIRAEEWADRLGTIGYEVVCGISARVPRVPIATDPHGRRSAS
jgi:alanine racemase